jgi:ADP-heptose:LPS heptosyltransferase/glycosyltransferase involved in cell wall biosynthesis
MTAMNKYEDKRITVCAATKNRVDMLHQLLWSLIRQRWENWDLVLVDDSDVPVQWDRTGVYPRLFSEMRRTGHDVRIAAGPRAGRIGAAYQVGLSAAKQENPLFLRADDDSWLEPDYLAELAKLMQDESVAAVGGLFLHPGQSIETLEPGDDLYKHGTIEHLSDSVNIQWFRHSDKSPIPVEHLTANILFSRKWLETIGGFESNLYRQHRDETQATWRLHIEGARVLVAPRAVAWHLRGVNGGARGHHADVYLDDHRRFMAQRKTMKPGIHLNLGHAIGDGFMATPMLEMMRRMNPGRNISVFAPWAKAVLAGNPNVDEIAEHYLDAQRTVRLEQSVYAWASARQWKGHLAQAYCEMLNLPSPPDVTPRLFLDDDSTPQDLPEKDYVVIAGWSNALTFDFYQTSGNKNWPIERWTAVVARLHDMGLTIVQLRGCEDEPRIEGIDLDFLARPLREVFHCIARGRALVSVDTMAHHAAAALGTPAVVLWGRSKPDHFGYRKQNIINIRGDCPGLPVRRQFYDPGKAERVIAAVIEERPCIDGDQWAMDKQVCPIEGRPCMSGISTDQVFTALEALLQAAVEES